MSIISIILTIIANLPAIISIVKEIISLIHDVVPKGQQGAALSRLAGVLKDAKASGDMSGLKAMHDELSSMANAPDTLKL